MEKRKNNPIIAYWRESAGGKYLQVSIDNAVLADAMKGIDGKTSFAVFFNKDKRTDKTPDIVVKASTLGEKPTQKEDTKDAGSQFPFSA